MIQAIVSNLKAKAARSAQFAACGMVAAIAASIALVFLFAALFVWLARQFGTIEACLMFGGGFLVVAAIAALVLVLLRRRPAPPPLNLNAAMPWNDPALLAMGLQAARTMGGRRAGAVGLVGAFVVGLLLSRAAAKK